MKRIEKWEKMIKDNPKIIKYVTLKISNHSLSTLIVKKKKLKCFAHIFTKFGNWTHLSIELNTAKQRIKFDES